MKVTWHYVPTPSTQPDFRFAEENRDFRHFANVIHEKGVTAIEPWFSYARIRMVETGWECNNDDGVNMAKEKLNEVYGDISSTAVYKEEITEKTLELSAYNYHAVFFCPVVQKQMIEFYQNLFENFSLETVLKTLVRIMSFAIERNSIQNYNAAKELFNITSVKLNLQYGDIIAITSGTSELKLYEEQKTDKTIKDLEYISRLINHPVHISEKEKLSAFIPFCSFGDDQFEKVKDFQGSLCSLFREKVVFGQVCYEADINKLR